MRVRDMSFGERGKITGYMRSPPCADLIRFGYAKCFRDGLANWFQIPFIEGYQVVGKVAFALRGQPKRWLPSV